MSGDGLPRVEAARCFSVPVSPKTVWIFVELAFEDGLSGWGESTLFGAEEAVVAEVKHANTLLSGQSFGGPGEALSALRMAHASEARRNVISAIEQAFLDATARWVGLPLATMLGGPCRRRVPFYANINRGISDRSADGFAARAREVVAEQGCTAVKIAPFDGVQWRRADQRDAGALLAAGIDRISAVREAIGPAAKLLVDCHSRLSPVMARDVLRAVEADDLFWLEEPLDEDAFSAETGRALRGFANDRGIRIAGGEKLASMTGARDLLARGILDAVLPDLRWTGIRTGMAMLEMADASGVAVSLHNPVGPILDRISLQVAASLGSFLILERQTRESPLFEHIFGGALTADAGDLLLDAGPGFGPPPDRTFLKGVSASAITRPATYAGTGGAGADA